MANTRWPRALVVGPDSDFARIAETALSGEGFEVYFSEDAETGMKKLAATSADLVIVELDMEGRNGEWFIRRIRDDYVGKPPRIIALGRDDSHVDDLAAIGADAMILKPVDLSVLKAASTGVRAAEKRLAADVLREMVRLSVLSADMEVAMQTLAQRLARVLRVRECVVRATVGETVRVASATGRPPEEDDPCWKLADMAMRCQVPIIEAGTRARTVVTTPLQAAQGAVLGSITLIDTRPRILPKQVLEWLRDLGRRIGTEISWLSVHLRIATDRDQLRERSMYDPMLGVWTRASLEQQLPVEVAELQMRKDPLTFAVLDVRGMREVNRQLGHIAGDTLLQHVASKLTQLSRPQDLVARYSGDRFALALLGTSLEKAVNHMESIQRALTEPLEYAGNEITPRIAAGLSPLMGESDNANAALARAAGAAAEAKASGQPLATSETVTTDIEAPLSEALAGGTTLGGMYQVVHEISRGAMGVVYRAEDLGLGRHVALKTLRPDLARDEQLVKLFRREAATLAKLRHDNLVQVYAFGIDQEHLFFVMELVEGESLEDRMNQVEANGNFMPLIEVRAVLPQIASALDAMHDAGILHRDVKPANILHDRRRDRAVLVDVGIATGEDRSAPAGTPGFAAPEVFRGERHDASADVYGLAATAYAVLVNDLPFDVGTDRVLPILARQSSGPPAPASSKRPRLPKRVDEVLGRALHPSPGERYQRASDFSAALVEALEGAAEDVAAGTDSGAIRAIPSSASGEKGLRTTWLRVQAEEALQPHPETDQNLSRGVLFRAAHQAVLTQPKFRGPRTLQGSAPRAITVLGSGWLQQLSHRRPELAEALGTRGSRFAWYPTRSLIDLLEAAAEGGQDAEKFSQLLGKKAAQSTFVGFFGADPSQSSIQDILATADVFWHRYHNWGEIEVGAHDSGEVDLLIRNGPAHALLCLSTIGLLEHIVAVSGQRNGHVTHPECAANGARACRFRVSPTP